jgi:hypothetical protein
LRKNCQERRLKTRETIAKQSENCSTTKKAERMPFPTQHTSTKNMTTTQNNNKNNREDDREAGTWW